MTKEHTTKLESLCLAMVDHFHSPDTTGLSMAEWMKDIHNCEYLVKRIQDMKNILENKDG